jgi:nitrate reductase gamma subunit
MPGVALLPIAYVSLVICLVVMLYRTIQMARRPIHLRWELAPIPHEKGKGKYGGSYFEEFEWWTKKPEKSFISEAVYMFQEIVFLKAVWEHFPRLWYFSFPFHTGMYLLIVAAVPLVVGAVLNLIGVPTAGWAWLDTLVVVLAAAGCLLGGLGALGLLISRLTDPRLRAVQTGITLFNLAFLVAVFLTGGIALIVFSDFSRQLTAVVQALLTADISVQVPAVLAVHVVLVFLFLAYLPFTQMLHFVAKYFTYHRVRWDDRAMTPGSPMEKEVTELLQQPVTWSAAHLKADGKKNWVDIVTDTGKEEEDNTDTDKTEKDSE